MAVIFGKSLITLWVGEGFIEASSILTILSISTAFAVAQNPAIGLMYALNKHHYYAGATVVEAVANLLLSIYLAKQYGMVGVALGTMIPMLIIKVLVMPLYVHKVAKVNLSQYLKPIITPALVAAAVTILMYSHNVGGNALKSIPYLFLGMAGTGGLYVLCCGVVAWSTDKQKILALLSK